MIRVRDATAMRLGGLISGRCVAVFAVCALVVLSAADASLAATPGAPPSGLVTAGGQVAALQGAATLAQAKRLLASVSASLASATAGSLWSDSDDPIAPPEGSQVFVDTGNALAGLRATAALRDPALSPNAIAGAEALIVAADRASAEDAIIQAAGAAPGALAAAAAFLTAGDRAAPRFQDIAARLYGQAWQAAFAALNQLVVERTTHVPATALSAAGEAGLGPTVPIYLPTALTGAAPLTANGKPEVFFYGIGACPLCAAERWPLVVALSQFGTFSGLQLGESASFDGALISWLGDFGTTIKTLGFYGSHYVSPYISFVTVEAATNQPGDLPLFGLQPLQTPTADETAVLNAYDLFDAGPPYGTFFGPPFVDVANHYVQNLSYDPTALAGESWGPISNALSSATTSEAQLIDGTAVMYTAEICDADGQRPLSVCNQPVVKQWETTIGG